jgi:hypothetical protein
MIAPRTAALVFAGLTGVVIAFQLALAAGMPWGAYAMGGAFPGVYPPPMRGAAVVQAAILGGVALIVLVRAGIVWRGRLRWPAWLVTGLLAVGVVLNLITPSGMERLIWGPVSLAMFLCSLRVAAAPAASR